MGFYIVNNRFCYQRRIGETKETNVVIPEGVEVISESTFRKWKELETVIIPKTVKKIESNAFFECEKLKSVILPEGLEEIGDDAFSKCRSFTSIIIPDSVKHIGYEAFKLCTALHTVKMSNNVEIIKGSAFQSCCELRTVNIPNSLTKIEERVFFGCINLRSIIIPDSVTVIEKKAFSKCEFTSIDLPEKLKTLGEEAFNGCKLLSSIKIPAGLTEIARGAFQRCENLESIVLPDNIKKIGNSAFSGCGNLESIVLPDSIEKIGDSAFSHCGKLSSIHIPSSVTKIGESAFEECNALSIVKFDKIYDNIPNNTFYKSNVEDYLIYDETSKQYINYKSDTAPEAFKKLIINTFIPNGILDLSERKSLRKGQYYENFNIKTLIIGNKIKTIPKNAFGAERDWYDNYILEVKTGRQLEYVDPDAFSCRRIFKYTIINDDGSTDTYSLEERNNDNDISAVLMSLCKSEIRDDISDVLTKYDLMITMYEVKPTPKITEQITENSLKTAIYLIDNKNIEMLKRLASHPEIFSYDKIVRLNEYIKGKRNIAEIREIVKELSKNIKKTPSPKNIANEDAEKNDHTEFLTIENGRLTAIAPGEYKELVIPSSVKAIDKQIFGKEVKIKKLVLPSSLKKISNENFMFSWEISEIVISEGTESIGSQAFESCAKLKKVTIPSSVISIGEKAFNYCCNLVTLDIGNGVMTIGDRVFANCEKLVEATIPSSVASLGKSVFEKCKSLTSITLYNDDLQSIDFDKMFAGCKKLNNIILPSGSTFYNSVNGVLYDRNNEIVYAAEGANEITVSKDLKRCKITYRVKKINIVLAPVTNKKNPNLYRDIQISASTINEIDFIVGDKTYSFDLSKEKKDIFYMQAEFSREEYYANKKISVCKLLNDVIKIILTGEHLPVWHERLGEVTYHFAHSGSITVAPLFALRIKLAEVVSELHGIDKKEIFELLCEDLFSEITGEPAVDELREIAAEYFNSHKEQLIYLDDNSKLKKLIGNDLSLEKGLISDKDREADHHDKTHDLAPEVKEPKTEVIDEEQKKTPANSKIDVYVKNSYTRSESRGSITAEKTSKASKHTKKSDAFDTLSADLSEKDHADTNVKQKEQTFTGSEETSFESEAYESITEKVFFFFF